MAKITIGADHGGFTLKEELKKYLSEKGHQVEDIGTHSTEAVDYPDIAFLVAHSVAKNHGKLSIFSIRWICGDLVTIKIIHPWSCSQEL